MFFIPLYLPVVFTTTRENKQVMGPIYIGNGQRKNESASTKELNLEICNENGYEHG